MAPADELLRLARDQVDQVSMILLDPAGRVCGWLMGAQRTFGYDSAEMLGKTLERIFTSEDIERRVPQTELESAARGGKGEDDRWLVRKDGTRIWVTGVVQCLSDADGRIVGYAKILQDRSDLKTEFDTLRARIDAQREELGRRNLVLTTMAHELRNPMGVIQNAVEIIRRLYPDDMKLATPTQMLTRQVVYMGTLIEDILESARLHAGKVVLQIERVPLATVIRKAAENNDAAIRAKHQSIELMLPLVPIEIDADATRLQQVFGNLISNASKFSPDRARIWVSTMPENEFATVRVRDEGRGISAELLPHVFELFAQGRQELSGSLGIGLSIVRQYVEMHGGTVAVRSAGTGRGSEFIVRLPIRQPAPTAAPGDAAAS